MKKAIIGLLVAGAAIAANAQDKALLETLVKKGMLTQQEAAQIAKESVAVTPATKSTKSIKIFGGAQGWYTWGKDTVKAGTATSPKQTSGFTLRYVKLGVEADVGGGWSATVVTDFGSEGSSRNYLDKVVASKKVDLDYLNGTLQLGLRKANMGYEQNMCDFGQLAIERSVATNFFTRGSYGDYSKNFGGRTVGVFWDGNITQVEGLYYSLAVTSGLTESTDGFLSSAQNSSALSFYASMGYKNIAEIKGESLAYDFGMNFGYAPQGMRDNSIRVNESRGSVWGINPYATASWKGLTAIAEFFLQQYEDYTPFGSGSGICKTPLGANLTVAYKMDMGDWGAIEPVARWSYVYANGGPIVSEFADDLAYNQAMTGYIGLNWYATASVKTSLGYEFGYFDQDVDGGAARTYSNSVRAQVQVLF